MSFTEFNKELLDKKLCAIEEHLSADVLNFYGPIRDGIENEFLSLIETLAADEKKKKLLYVILTTEGGSAHAVERYVNILRHHYQEINFIVPDFAYSAGTIFCMSGDNIYMDYFSVLGPIDPQVRNKEGRYVPALGYLDKVNELIEKSANNTLTNAEFIILRELDLADLRNYEQARELTVALLTKWLVNYKFKNWNVHETTKSLKGKKVTLKEKEKRANEIADALGDNKRWKSHGRPINKETLEKDLRLKIEDLAANTELRTMIRDYYQHVDEYSGMTDTIAFIQTRLQFLMMK